jgi:hypothetical protein
MAIILIEATSTIAADDIVAAVQAGRLWGVDMGTTSAAGAYADKALVDCTKTRAGKLMEECPEGIEVSAFQENPPAFTSADDLCQIWYLRGLIS